MDINVAQVLINAAVTIVVGWLAGTFGVRQGLQKAQREKAFDRRLEWYEGTFNSFNSFTIYLRKLINTPVTSDQFDTVRAAIEQSAVQVRTSVDKATMYAKRRTLVSMRRFFVELDAVTHRPIGPRIEDVALVDKANAIVEVANKITFELARTIRKELGMDRITVKDFRWGRPS
ncbi:MAG TPA: hypothetical protein VJ646_19490 [Candidatus Binatia bacterium]|nr:hypothetical protein [Candidatus Binatia bacterium]